MPKQKRVKYDPNGPVNWNRLRQLFGGMTHRRQPVLQGYALGDVVEATTPEELSQKTTEAWIDKSQKEPEN
jgi:hypothetical protein